MKYLLHFQSFLNESKDGDGFFILNYKEVMDLLKPKPYEKPDYLGRYSGWRIKEKIKPNQVLVGVNDK